MSTLSRALMLLVSAGGWATACATPAAPSAWSVDQIRAQIVATNVSNSRLSGRLTRWAVPIPVVTNGIARAEESLSHVEAWTGGRVSFQRMSGSITSGLVFVEGGAVGPNGAGGCGNVTDAPPSQPNSTHRYSWDASGVITGAYSIHLGSESCQDALEGNYPSAIAEHELLHALGFASHFDGFIGNEGLADARALAVLVNLYANPPGTTAEALTIWPVR